MAARELTLTCADGKTESVELVNDGIDPIGLVSTLALAALTASNVASAVRSVELGDQIYYGALAALTGGTGLLTALTSWQPSLPVRVNHPGSVCQSTTPAAETPATPATPATTSPDAPPAPMEPPPPAEPAAPAPAAEAPSPEA